MAANEITQANDHDESARPFALVILHGDEPRLVTLSEKPLVLGRAAPADIVVEVPTLSREHVRLARRSDGLPGVEVTDLGSKNGVRLRGERVEHALLDVGDSIEAGGVTVLVTGAAPPRRERRVGQVALHALLQAIDDELVRQELTQRWFTVAVVRVEDASFSGQRLVDRCAPLGEDFVCWLLPELGVSEARRAIGATRIGLSSSRGAESAGALVEAARRAFPGADPSAPAVSQEPGDRVIAVSAAMRATFALTERFAPSDQPVLVAGETGSGKEVVARHVHARSPRSRGPFFALNCAAIPATLVESTLFGHERGAFTGANERRKGAFEEAHGGTLFLDEVGELSPAAQAVLLRVLETKTLLRVGGNQEIGVDVRLVSATHRDLRREVAEGRFRSDLFHRIGVLVIEVPPLRERPEDVVALAQSFVRRATERAGRPPLALAPDAVQALLAHDWPGNARELRNVLERAVLLASGDRLTLGDVAQRVTTPPSVPATKDDGQSAWDLRARLREFESELIVGALEASGGNQINAASLLGLPRRTLVHKIAKLGIRRRWGRS